MATAEFFKFADILSAALSQHHLLGFEIAIVIVQLLSCIQLFVTPWTAASQPGILVPHYLPEFAQVYFQEHSINVQYIVCIV